MFNYHSYNIKFTVVTNVSGLSVFSRWPSPASHTRLPLNKIKDVCGTATVMAASSLPIVSFHLNIVVLLLLRQQ